MRLESILLCAIALCLAACSDGKVEAKDTAAAYQGKPDNPPWDSPAEGGNKAQWERQIEARTLNQNEYARIR